MIPYLSTRSIASKSPIITKYDVSRTILAYFIAASIVGKFIPSLFVASIKSGSCHYRFNPGPNIFLLSAPRTPNWIQCIPKWWLTEEERHRRFGVFQLKWDFIPYMIQTWLRRSSHRSLFLGSHARVKISCLWKLISHFAFYSCNWKDWSQKCS